MWVTCSDTVLFLVIMSGLISVVDLALVQLWFKLNDKIVVRVPTMGC